MYQWPVFVVRLSFFAVPFYHVSAEQDSWLPCRHHRYDGKWRTLFTITQRRRSRWGCFLLPLQLDRWVDRCSSLIPSRKFLLQLHCRLGRQHPMTPGAHPAPSCRRSPTWPTTWWPSRRSWAWCGNASMITARTGGTSTRCGGHGVGLPQRRLSTPPLIHTSLTFTSWWLTQTSGSWVT